MIGFNESMTFQGNATEKVGWLIWREPISKNPWVCSSERGSPQEQEELIIPWFYDLHRWRSWGRAREPAREERKGRESGENKCEIKILNDQNSTHKALRLRPRPQLCQLPNMLYHGNRLKPGVEVLEQREGSLQLQTRIPLFCTVCARGTYFAPQGFKDRRQ